MRVCICNVQDVALVFSEGEQHLILQDVCTLFSVIFYSFHGLHSKHHKK